MSDGWWQVFHGLDGLDGPEGETTEVGSAGEVVAGEDSLRLSLGGEDWRLDGSAGDSVTLADANGMTIYADLDADGEVDHITTVHAAGGFEVWSSDPHAAEWGLSEEGSGNGISDPGETWGLPSEPTPELGQQDRCVDQQKRGWWRIEQEETGRS